MKKIMSIMLGLTLVLGSASFAVAQENPKESKTKKANKKKKEDKKEDKK